MLEKLDIDLKDAMRNKNKVELITIRAIKSSIKNEEINKKRELEIDEISSIIMKEIKSRKDANLEFEKASRDDLVQKNNEEIIVLEKYLPEMLSEDEILNIVCKVIEEVKPSGLKDIGSVMKAVIPEVKGKADMSIVNKIIKDKLNNI